MTSLFARYTAGAHQEVWAEINQSWTSYGEEYGPKGTLRHYTIDRKDAGAVLQETFARVARNTDRLITRLRETGYRFECEAGRDAAPKAPRRATDINAAASFLEQTFRHVEIYDAGLAPLPPALEACARLVGDVDLRQRFAPEAITAYPTMPLDPASKHADAFAALESIAPQISPDEAADQQRISREDAAPHPHAADPVLSRLGDWDPLQLDFDYLTYDLTSTPPEVNEGLIWRAEFAASFEHKANVSGADNPYIAFPQASFDPIVRAEGHHTTFSNYLRHAFRNGGFLGIPRALRGGQALTRSIAPGLFLPDHPIFARLAEGLEPF